MLDDVVDGNVIVAEGAVNELFSFGKFEGREDAGFGGAGGTVAAWEEVFEFAQNIFGAFAEFGAFFDEVVAAFAAGRIDGAGDGEDLAAGFGGEVGGDERAAGKISFDDDGA